MGTKEQSRRQRLLWLAETGRLRDALSRHSVDLDVQDLVVDLCIRYSQPRRKPRLRVSSRI